MARPIGRLRRRWIRNREVHRHEVVPGAGLGASRQRLGAATREGRVGGMRHPVAIALRRASGMDLAENCPVWGTATLHRGLRSLAEGDNWVRRS